MSTIHDLVYSPEALEFVKNAGAFAEMMTGPQPDDRKVFVRKVLTLLPAMYSGILRVPVTEPVYEGENEKFITEEEWSSVYQLVLNVMGSQNEYLDIPDEDEYDRMELISREISEDLADIYQDIGNFLGLYRNGTEEIMNDALWECMLNFENFWGAKILRVSAALHRILVMDEETLEQMDREGEEKSRGKRINTDEWFISKRQKDIGEEGDFQ